MGCDSCTCGDRNCDSPIFIQRTVGTFLGDYIGEVLDKEGDD